MSSLLLYCRAGFENECAKEIAQCMSSQEAPGYIRSKPQAGYVEWVFHEPVESAQIDGQVRFRDLIFARQLIRASSWVDGLPAGDRISVLLPVIASVGMKFSTVLLETADTNEAKELSTFCRQFTKPLEQSLRAAGLIEAGDTALPRLHLFFTGSARVCIGWSDPADSSPWPMGIPRLTMPRQAPSRSTLKLAEALQWFIGDYEDRNLLHEGNTAVDLGAAPGGWTWQLVRRGLHVTAVDNGPINADLLLTGHVDHLRVDGFKFRPRHPVDWMVCDMVEQPIRIAMLIADWLAQRHCSHSIFNLKLPMKKRYDEVIRCRDAMQQRWSENRMRCELRFKHLYHDREEITGYVVRADRSR